MGWRLINTTMKKRYGVDTMPAAGENVAGLAVSFTVSA